MCTNSSFGTRVPGRYIAVGLSSGVAVKRGSTVFNLLLLYKKKSEMWAEKGSGVSRGVLRVLKHPPKLQLISLMYVLLLLSYLRAIF